MTLTWYAEIDWDLDGTYTDEAGRLLAFTRRSGRNASLNYEGYERIQPGELTLTLDNFDGRYDPYNTSSPLTGYIKPNRSMRLRVTDGTLVYTRFVGKVSDIRPISGQQQVKITCSDGLDFLRRAMCINSSVQTNYAVSDAMLILLQNAGWPYADATGWIFPGTLGVSKLGSALIENNGDALPYWWSDPDKSTLLEMQEIADAFCGEVYVRMDGTFGYKTRDYGAVIELAVDQSVLSKEIIQQQPWDEIRNNIRIYSYPRKTESPAEIYRLNYEATIDPQDTLTIWAQYQKNGMPGFATTVTTINSGDTDFQAFSATAGGGIEKTGSVIVTQTNYATQSLITLHNDDAAMIYVYLLKLRGIMQTNENRTESRSSDDTSITAYGNQHLAIDNNWIQTTLDAIDHANYALARFKDPRRVCWIEFKDRPEYQLNLDLLDEIQLTAATLGINMATKITHIEDNWNAGGSFITTMRLEPAESQIFSNFWIFPGILGTSKLTW
jgi:hypothetical protein